MVMHICNLSTWEGEAKEAATPKDSLQPMKDILAFLLRYPKKKNREQHY
jgi:hypothetical protein